MKSSVERRYRILEALNVRRYDTMDNLALEFNVSRRTIQRDIVTLSCSVPIFALKGTNGGVYVPSDWYVGRKYLTPVQEELIKELINDLEPERCEIMQSILDAFAMPKVNHIIGC